MAQFGASIQTAQVTSGNFQTTVDPSVSGYAGYPNNPGNRNPLGAAYYDSTGTFSNPWGVPGKYRYVQYVDAGNTAITLLTAPAICYWVDATFTSVTPLYSASGWGINGVAGLIMPNTTAIPNLVLSGATSVQTNLNNNFIWICVGGYVSGALAISPTGSITAGAAIIGSTTAFESAFVTANTAPTNRVLGWAVTATGTPSTGLYNILVTLES